MMFYRLLLLFFCFSILSCEKLLKEIEVSLPANFQTSTYNTALSSDGKYLAVCNHEFLQIYELHNGSWHMKGESIKYGYGFDPMIFFSSDGKNFTLSLRGYRGFTKRINVFNWDGKSWKKRGEEFDFSELVGTVIPSFCLSVNGNTLAVAGSCTSDGAEFVFYDWNGNSWEEKGKRLRSEKYNCFDIYKISADGTTVAFDRNDKVCVYELKDNKWIESFSYFETSLRGLVLSPDGRYLAFANNNTVHVFSFENGAWHRVGEEVVIGCESIGYNCLSFLDDSKSFLVVSKGESNRKKSISTLSLYSWDEGSWEKKKALGIQEYQHDFSVSSNAKVFALSYGDKVKLYHLNED